MSASKLTETVSETECQARLESQDKINNDLNRTLQDILKAINGTPGDMCDKVESCNEKIDALNDKLIILESKDLVGSIRATNERVDHIEEAVKLAMRKAERTQWSKMFITSLSTATACLGIAAAAYGLMMTLDKNNNMKQPAYVHPDKTRNSHRLNR